MMKINNGDLDAEKYEEHFKNKVCYIDFWTNTLGKIMNLFISAPSYGLNSITSVLL